MVSEVAIGGIVAGGVTALNLAFNYAMTRKGAGDRRVERAEDHREWYRRTLFEKRLSAVQEAHGWLMELRDGASQVGRARSEKHGSTDFTQADRDLEASARNARSWWNKNNVSLEGVPRRASNFVGVTTTARGYASGHYSRSELEKSFGELEEELQARADALMALGEERSP